MPGIHPQRIARLSRPGPPQFPRDTAAHSLKNNAEEPLVCLVVGQRLAQDISDYPNQQKRLYRHSGRWDVVDMQNLNDPRE